MAKNYIELGGVHIDEEIQMKVIENYFPQLTSALIANSKTKEISDDSPQTEILKLFHNALKNTLLRSNYDKGRLFLKATSRGDLYYAFGRSSISWVEHVSLAFSEITGNINMTPEIYIGTQGGSSQLYVKQLDMVAIASAGFHLNDYDLQVWIPMSDMITKKNFMGGDPQIFMLDEPFSVQELLKREQTELSGITDRRTVRRLTFSKEFKILANQHNDNASLKCSVTTIYSTAKRNVYGRTMMDSNVGSMTMTYAAPFKMDTALEVLQSISENDFLINTVKYEELLRAPIDEERELLKKLRAIKKAKKIGTKKYYEFIKESVLKSKDTTLQDIYQIPQVVNAKITNSGLELTLDLENDFIISDSKGRAIVRYKPGLGYDNTIVKYDIGQGSLRSENHSLFHVPLGSNACLGGYQTDIVEAATEREYTRLANLIIEYLSFRNSDDPRGNIMSNESSLDKNLSIESILPLYKNSCIPPFIEIMTHQGWRSSTEMYTKLAESYKKFIVIEEEMVDGELLETIYMPGRTGDYRRGGQEIIRTLCSIDKDLAESDPDYISIESECIRSVMAERVTSTGTHLIAGIRNYRYTAPRVEPKFLPSLIRIFEVFYGHSKEFPLNKKVAKINRRDELIGDDITKIDDLYDSLGIDG